MSEKTICKKCGRFVEKWCGGVCRDCWNTYQRLREQRRTRESQAIRRLIDEGIIDENLKVIKR